MADRTLRGSRMVSFSMETSNNVVPSERQTTVYVCPNEHRIELPFSIEAEIPPTWECRCGEDALLLDGEQPARKATKPARTHWDMLLERRSVPELEALLEERLEVLRASRGEHSAAKRSA